MYYGANEIIKTIVIKISENKLHVHFFGGLKEVFLKIQAMHIYFGK